MSLEQPTEKVLRVAEALLRQPLGAAFPLPGELTDWDLQARLERALARAMEGGAAPAETALPVEPAPADVRGLVGRPAPQVPASPFSQAGAASSSAIFASPYEVSARQALGLIPEEQVQWPGASARLPQARAAESVSARAGAVPQARLEPEGRASTSPQPSPFPRSGTVAGHLGIAPAPVYGAPAPAGSSPRSIAARRSSPALTPVPTAERGMQAPPAQVTPPAPSLPSFPERSLFGEGSRPAGEGSAPVSRALRMVSSPTELAALLQSHVSTPGGIPLSPAGLAPAPAPSSPAARASTAPSPAALAPAPELAGGAAPGPTHTGTSPAATTPEVASLPEVSFADSLRDGVAGGPAEELLLDKLLDRLQDRLREESIRRFGLTGGEL